MFSFVVLAVVAGHQAPVTWTGPHPDYLSHDRALGRLVVPRDRRERLPGAAAGRPVHRCGWSQNAWAFYPAFPLLSRLLMSVTGLGFPVVASTLALVCGAGAAVLMAVLLRDRVGPRVAFAAVLVYASFIASPILQVAYTESLAMLLLVGFLLALVAASGGWSPRCSRWASASPGRSRCHWGWSPWSRSSCAGAAGPASGCRAVSCSRWAPVLAACGVAGLAWPAIAWWRTGVALGLHRHDGDVARRPARSTPFRPWLDIARYVGGDTLGPTGLAVLVVVLVLMVLGPWARALGPQLRAWCLAYPAYLGRRPRPVDQHLPLPAAAVPARRRRSSAAAGAGGHHTGFAGGPACSSWPGCVAAGVVGLGAVPVRAAVGLPAVTDLRAVAPVRALRDRLLTWPTWAVLLGFYLLTRVLVAARHPGGRGLLPEPRRGRHPRPRLPRHGRHLGRHLVPPDRRLGLSVRRCPTTRSPTRSPSARGRSTRSSRWS